MTAPAGRTVAIWRSLLLPASETFVRNHGDALTRWRPVYFGAVKVDSALAAPTDIIAFPDSPRGRRGWQLLRLTGGSRRLRGLIKVVRPALIHAHFGGDGWLVSRVAVRLGVPLIITVHGADVTRQAQVPGLRGVRQRRNLRQAFARAAMIIAVSGFIRERAIALGADPAKVRVHHTGVPIGELPAAVAKQWDVVFVGRFVAKKGIDDLVEAAGLLAALRPRILFIGAGPLEPGIRERAAELGLDAEFLGVQEPSVVRRCLAEAKVLAAPSKTAPDGDSEGLPTTILEAAGLGVPAVSTYHSGIPEAVLNGETGLLCREGDRAALAANIERLLTDDDLREQLGKAARLHIETHFDLEHQTRKLEELYEEAT